MKPRHRAALWGGMLLFPAAAVSAPAAVVGLLPLNVNLDHIAHNDTLAWSLLGVLGVTLGLVAACGLGIYRQFRRNRPKNWREIQRLGRIYLGEDH